MRTCAVLLLLASFSVLAQTAFPVKAGGVELLLPPPAKDFTEVGDKLRTTVFDLLAPSSNRLLSAYLPAHFLVDARAGKASPIMATYAMLQVPRQAEYADCTPECFAEVLQSTAGGMPAVNDKVKESQDEIMLRLKALGAKQVEVGRPEMLGMIFQKKDAAGMAMLVSVKQGETAATMICGMGILRLRQRLAFAYLFQKLESPESLDWVRNNLASWADALLAANR